MLENLEQQNWTNFCTHQLGDWHGTWTVYSQEGTALKSFKCIRSFRSSDLETVEHTNSYFYEDGKTRLESFGPYLRPKMRGLYLDNSFSWGTKSLEDNFFFETGFRHQSQRVSLVAVYAKGQLTQVITIREHLDKFSDFSDLSMTSEFQSVSKSMNSEFQGVSKSINPEFQSVSKSINPEFQGISKSINPEFQSVSKSMTSEFQGVSKSMNPELEIFEEIKPHWNSLKDPLIFNLPGNIFLSCPPHLTSNCAFDLTVDWLATSTLLYRGIRSFDSSGFKLFTLQTFQNI